MGGHDSGQGTGGEQALRNHPAWWDVLRAGHFGWTLPHEAPAGGFVEKRSEPARAIVPFDHR